MKIYMNKDYPTVYLGKGKEAYLSRVIMEEYLSRPLTPEEVVHHIDKDVFNNELSNLKVLSWGEHCRLHQLGKVLSKETRRKISKAKLGRTLSEETRKKLSKANLGKTLSEETRKKISEACLGKTRSKETRRKISEASLGRTFSEETRRKMSKSKIAYWRRNQ